MPPCLPPCGPLFPSGAQPAPKIAHASCCATLVPSPPCMYACSFISLFVVGASGMPVTLYHSLAIQSDAQACVM